MHFLPIKTEHFECERIFLDTLPIIPEIPVTPRHPTTVRPDFSLSDAASILAEGWPSSVKTCMFLNLILKQVLAFPPIPDYIKRQWLARGDFALACHAPFLLNPSSDSICVCFRKNKNMLPYFLDPWYHCLIARTFSMGRSWLRRALSM